MSRISYRREMLSWGFVPLMLSCLQGGTVAVFIKKTFADVDGITSGQLDLAVGLVAASKAIGHMTSFWWARTSRGHRKVQFLFCLQVATGFVVAAFAFAPRSATGLWMVTLLCIVAWTLWSGVTTLRGVVWRANYNGEIRPRVAGHIMTVDALLVAVAGITIGYCLDLNPMTYQVLFPAFAVCGLFGAFLYRRIPFRREASFLRKEKESTKQFKRQSLATSLSILREDHWYRGYMACMFVMGFGNLMLHPILAIALTDQFNVGYQEGIAITTVIPMTFLTLSIPFWRRRLQRMHVIEFRAMHVWTFVAATSCVLVGVAMHQIAFLYFASVIVGVGWGGGALAWNLGHQHFSPPERDAEYMGVHVTLTGIRGVIGPILGVQIYMLLSRFGMQTSALLICFAICLFMNFAGSVGFVLLAKKRRSSPTPKLATIKP